MRSRGHFLGLTLAAAALGALPVTPACGAPGDPVTLEATVAWSGAPAGAPFAVVLGPDGRPYVADLSGLTPPPVLSPGDRVGLAGHEGSRPHELLVRSVVVLGSGPSPQPSAGGPVVAPPAGAPERRAPPATTPGPADVPPQPPEPSGRERVERVSGRVEVVRGQRVTLRLPDGRRFAVELPPAVPPGTVRPGDDLTVYGQREGERFTATGLVRVEDASGSALPGPPR